jgi:hypothetical protein
MGIPRERIQDRSKADGSAREESNPTRIQEAEVHSLAGEVDRAVEALKRATADYMAVYRRVFEAEAEDNGDTGLDGLGAVVSVLRKLLSELTDIRQLFFLGKDFRSAMAACYWVALKYMKITFKHFRGGHAHSLSGRMEGLHRIRAAWAVIAEADEVPFPWDDTPTTVEASAVLARVDAAIELIRKKTENQGPRCKRT